jgi:hypothetical protein
MSLDVLYNLSKIQLEIRAEETRICFALAAAPCAGSKQRTPCQFNPFSNEFILLDSYIVPQCVPANDFPRCILMHPGMRVVCRLPLDEFVMFSPSDLPTSCLYWTIIICSLCSTLPIRLLLKLFLHSCLELSGTCEAFPSCLHAVQIESTWPSL